jgi:soluble lytic murein transglycosylase-like protein
MARRATSKAATSKSQKAAPDQSWLRRALAYFPAWVLLIAILVLYVLNSTGRKLPLPDFFDAKLPVLGGRSSDKYAGIYNASAPLAELFSPSVDYWKPSILRWAQEAGLNPNLVATVMQIESCGHPYKESPAGAQGLFQIVPVYHFSEGDNQLDSDTNARAGLRHMKDCLKWSADLDLDGTAESDPDVGLALVCYNGGLGALQTPRDQWVEESRNYYVWGTGIWADAAQGHARSETLNAWLNAGGVYLCSEALQAQKLVDPLRASQ